MGGMLSLSLLPFVVAQAGSGFPEPQIWIVDDDGPGIFKTIQAAVDVAQRRDVILVKEGVYPGFVVKSEALTIVAEREATVEVRGPIEVRELGGADWVLLRGLTTPSDPGLPASSYATLHSNLNVGETWAEDCTFGRPACAGPGACESAFTGPAATTAAAQLILVRTTLRGGHASAGQPGAPGLEIDSSNVYLLDSVFEGGRGAPAEGTADGCEGGAGVYAMGGILHFYSGEYRGGDGGAGATAGCLGGGDGGPGLHMSGSDTVATVRQADFQGGLGGASACGARGTDGPWLANEGGFYTEEPEVPPSVETLSPARAGELQTFRVRGTPGDLIMLRYSVRAHVIEVPFQLALQFLEPPFDHLGAFVLPPSGVVELQRKLPDWTFRAAAFPFYVQPFAISPLDYGIHGLPSAFGWLPAGI